ncbi:MAG: phosphomannomutase/phosphoglucomutase [Deltaproteobacteria bacterium]|nr:phosphomannomutase/phosphoglucomutase [Deltaproteobacteria bacterium]MCD6265478.1 phosphomannomutase/phosphoglucomutase [Deltaproteobacteria bacterium]RLB21632.1 MAG: phosphomannomutase [Deltaproteobacteria bacterium]
MNPEIYREYDIRGVIGEDIREDEYFILGRGFGTYFNQVGEKTIVVGRDCRLSSPRIRDEVTEGLINSGCNVIDIGICPTPILYFALRHLKVDGGIMITASHNPSDYNGFKVCSGLETIYGKEIQKLRQIIERADFVSGKGEYSSHEIIKSYIERITGDVNINSGIKVGFDAGNGTAGPVGVEILQSLGCDLHDLYCDMDGSFPNHEPDPTVLGNMRDLITEVREQNLNVGIGVDGDGDRIGVVDSSGNIVFGDMLLLLFARDILHNHPGATIISEVKCSDRMYKDIEAHGGNPIMWKTGHSLIKSKMKETKALLAGEMSGHMFFADRYFGYDDAIYASCRLLEILSRTGKSLIELLADVPKSHTTPEIRVECPDSKKFQLVDRLKDEFSKQYKIIDVDGVRIVFDDGWGLVRASNTQPALVLRFEARSKERLEEIRTMVEKTIEKFG